MRAAVVGALLAAGCGSSAVEAPPLDAVPCAQPAWWGHAVRSSTIPLEVHYPDGVTDARAGEVLAMLESDWAIETGEMGFRAPLTGAACGSDDAVDVFLWPGQPESFVDALAPDDTTPQDDWFTYMAVDPEGEFGGTQLPTTLAHELDHMCQAADDYDEPIALLEATSTYVEAQIAPSLAARATTVADFQAHPGWSVDHDDAYDSWFMYGGELYLEVLRAAYFDSHASAIGMLWRGMRNVAAANEPDWADAVRAAVAPATLEDTIVTLAVWRWFVGANADARHLPDAAELATPALAGSATPATTQVALGTIDPLGAAYVTLSGGIATVQVNGLSPDLAVRLLVIPGAAGNDFDELTDPTLDASAGPRTLVVVVVPTGTYDPDARPAPAALDLSVAWAASW